MNTDNTYMYGAYVIVERIPMPKGRMLILGHDSTAAQPWCTGYLGESLGEYHGTMAEAWQTLAWRMAEGTGLVVGPEGSVVIRPGDVERVKAQALDLYGAWEDFRDILDEDIPTGDAEGQNRKVDAENEIRDEAEGMSDLLLELKLMGDKRDREPKPDIEAIERDHAYTTGAFVEDVTGGENWNK